MASCLNALILSLLGLSILNAGVNSQCVSVDIKNEWVGNYQADFSARTTAGFSSMTLDFTFSAPVDNVDFWAGTATKIDDQHFTLKQDQAAQAGDTIEFSFQCHYSGYQGVVVEAVLNGEDVCGTDPYTTEPPMPNPCEDTGMTPHDYNQVLCMSYLFYEAQRSGPLPADRRVTWRGDSALDDGKDVGLDLTGGYYDAGDHVKFGFPMAFTTTMLAWGLVDFKEGHEAAGQLEYGLDAVKWATDYFLKAHSDHYEFYGQCGQGEADHTYWGRPEDMTMDRPSMKITNEKPGSELAAETAAALSAAYLAFVDTEPEYAETLLASAEELYQFADERRENYHKSIPDAAAYYQSWSGYGDELTWAALWLARATGDNTYLDKAKDHWNEFGMDEIGEQFSWDDKKLGVYALFTLLDDDAMYEEHLMAFLNHIYNDKPYTPGGLVFLDTWGANRHAANVAFIALWAAKHGIEADTNREWGASQINYILGDGAGHSYVVGYGIDPPQRPHHRSSSCPPEPSTCTDGWAQKQDGPNPHVLYGALVGGPAQDGTYKDDRMDFVHNEVACDYNAAFTGALAAMVENNS